MGIFIPMFLIVIIDAFNNKIIDKKDIEKITRIPIIGYISHNTYKTEIPVVEKPRSTLTESFRSVRTALKYLYQGERNPIIAVSSTISSEGKTFVSINLAVIIASLSKKVLLVGLDLRKPRIHRVLDQSNDKGLSTYLIGEADFEDVVLPTGIKNLSFVPSGPIPPNPAELIDSEAMNDFFTRARKEFDTIILDTPPLAIVSDTLLLSKWVDINLFVVRQRFTSKYTLALIDELEKSKRLNNPGIVINDINISGYYGYGLRYGYSIGYGYNYGYGYYGHYSFGNYGKRKNGSGYYIDD